MRARRPSTSRHARAHPAATATHRRPVARATLQAARRTTQPRPLRHGHPSRRRRAGRRSRWRSRYARRRAGSAHGSRPRHGRTRKQAAADLTCRFARAHSVARTPERSDSRESLAAAAGGSSRAPVSAPVRRSSFRRASVSRSAVWKARRDPSPGVAKRRGQGLAGTWPATTGRCGRIDARAPSVRRAVACVSAQRAEDRRRQRLHRDRSVGEAAIPRGPVEAETREPGDDRDDRRDRDDRLDE